MEHNSTRLWVSPRNPDIWIDESARLRVAQERLLKDPSDRVAAGSASSIFIMRCNYRHASQILARFDILQDPCDDICLNKFVVAAQKRHSMGQAAYLFQSAIVDKKNLESVCCYLKMCFYAVKKGMEVDTSKISLNRFQGEIELDLAIISYLIATSRSASAIPIGEELTQHYPGVPEVWGWYARSLARKFRWSELRLVVEKSLNLHPTSVPLRRHLIHALEFMPSSEAQRTQLAWQVIQSTPDDVLCESFCFADAVCQGHLKTAALFLAAKYQIMFKGLLSEKVASRMVACTAPYVKRGLGIKL